MTGYTRDDHRSPSGTGAGGADTPYTNAPGSSVSTQPHGPQESYFGQAQAWTSRVSSNLTGQAKDLQQNVTATPETSYTDQVKGWTYRVASNLSGQLENLKGEINGADRTTGPTGVQGPTGSYQDSSRQQANSQLPYANIYNDSQKTHGPSQNPGFQASGHSQTQPSWVDKARRGVISSISYTQQGLDWTKNKVAGQTGQSTTAGSQQYAAGHPTATDMYHASSNAGGQYTAPAYVPPPSANSGVPGSVNPAYNRVYNAHGNRQ